MESGVSTFHHTDEDREHSSVVRERGGQHDRLAEANRAHDGEQSKEGAYAAPDEEHGEERIA